MLDQVLDPEVFLMVNGDEAMTPLSEARVPVLDRGFIFGDGVYEVVPVYKRVPFRLAQHLARLTRSLDSIGITNPFDTNGWKERIATLIAASRDEDQLVYMQVTRGVAKRGHAFPKDAQPTVFMMNNTLVLPSAELRASGASVVTAIDNRWLRCDIKSVSLLGNVLMAEHAAANQVQETVMFRDGYLTEASSSNVWVVKQGILYAPPKDQKILEGIRYGLIAEIAARIALPFKITPITRAEVETADEVMLSSATKEVLPVTSMDGKPVGIGKPGPVYTKIFEAYQDAKAASLKAAEANTLQRA
jgi:D-alanine transaminase